jgi:site-specific recombinase XerC
VCQKNPEALVFSDSSGEHLRRIRVSKGSRSWFKTALAASGLPPMTLHDLRYTAASLAISSGANVKAVQRMLDHASAAMTLDGYADLFDDDLDAVADGLNKATASANVGKLWAQSVCETMTLSRNPCNCNDPQRQNRAETVGFEP